MQMIPLPIVMMHVLHLLKLTMLFTVWSQSLMYIMTITSDHKPVSITFNFPGSDSLHAVVSCQTKGIAKHFIAYDWTVLTNVDSISALTGISMYYTCP